MYLGNFDDRNGRSICPKETIKVTEDCSPSYLLNAFDYADHCILMGIRLAPIAAICRAIDAQTVHHCSTIVSGQENGFAVAHDLNQTELFIDAYGFTAHQHPFGLTINVHGDNFKPMGQSIDIAGLPNTPLNYLDTLGTIFNTLPINVAANNPRTIDWPANLDAWGSPPEIASGIVRLASWLSEQHSCVNGFRMATNLYFTRRFASNHQSPTVVSKLFDLWQQLQFGSTKLTPPPDRSLQL